MQPKTPLFTSDSQHPPRFGHAVYLGDTGFRPYDNTGYKPYDNTGYRPYDNRPAMVPMVKMEPQREMPTFQLTFQPIPQADLSA